MLPSGKMDRPMISIGKGSSAKHERALREQRGIDVYDWMPSFGGEGICGRSARRGDVEAPVAEVERDVHRHDEEERDVHPNHPVAVVDKLVNDSEYVSKFDKQHEHYALSFRAPGAQ